MNSANQQRLNRAGSPYLVDYSLVKETSKATERLSTQGSGLCRLGDGSGGGLLAAGRNLADCKRMHERSTIISDGSAGRLAETVPLVVALLFQHILDSRKEINSIFDIRNDIAFAFRVGHVLTSEFSGFQLRLLEASRNNL